MAVYNEHINILVDDHAVTHARANVQQLQSLCKNIKMNIGGDSKLSNFNSRMQSIQRNTRSTVQELQKLNQSFNSIKGGSAIKSIAESLKALAKEEEIITKKKIKIDVKLEGADAAINKLKELSTEVTNLQHKNISLNVNAKGMDKAARQYERTYSRGMPIGNSRYGNYYGRNMNGTTGNGHKMDILGFNADNSMAYQYGSAFRKQGQTLNNMTEKFNRVNDAFLTFGMYLGTRDLTNTILETPARAETQKWLLGEMQQGQTTTDASGKEATLYQILDKTTDMLPISMQNVANPLYALQSSTGATAQQLADAIPIWANFGANVINMTGSEERAETAMEKLSYAFNGQYAGTDQFGISEASLNAHGFDTKTMSGKAEYLPEFLKAVEEITPDATKSMNNFNGQKMLVSKDFARAGKRLWNDGLGPLLTTIVGGFHQYDAALSGIPTTLMTAASAAITFGTTLTGVIGPTVQMIGMWGQLSGSLRAAHQNGGILSNLWKTIRGGNAALKGQPFGWGNPFVSGAGDGVTGGFSSPQLASIDGSVKAIASEVAVMQRNDMVFPQKMSKKDSFEYAKSRQHLNYKRERWNLENSKYFGSAKGGKENLLSYAYLNSLKTDLEGSHKGISENLSESKRKTESFTDSLRNDAKIMKRNAELEKTWMGRRRLSLLNYKEDMKGLSTRKKVTKTLGSFKSTLGSTLGSMFSWNKALVGGTALMIGGSVLWGIAYSQSQKFREASTQLSRTMSGLTTTAVQSLGTIIGSLAYGGKFTGFDAMAKAVMDLSEWLNVTFHNSKDDGSNDVIDYKGKHGVDPKTGKETYTKFETEAEKYGWEDTDTEAVKQTKKSAVDTAAAWHSFYRTVGGIVDPITAAIGHPTDITKWADITQKEEIEKARKGDFNQGYRNMALKKEEEISGKYFPNWDAYMDVRNGKNNLTYSHPDRGLVNAIFEPAVLLDYLGVDSIYNQDNPKIPYSVKNRPQSNVGADILNNRPANDITYSDIGGWMRPMIQAMFPQVNGLTEIFGGQNPRNAANLGADAQNQAMQQALANPNGTQPLANQGAGTQAAQQYVSDFNQGMTQQAPMLSQSIQTALTTGMGQEGGGMQVAATQMATDFNTQFSQGLTTQPLDLTQYFSTITTQLQTQEAQFNTSGQNAGNQYSSGISSGMAGAAAAASAEAGNILAAMDIAGEAYQKGYAAGQAFDEGYRAGGGIKSPGYASKHAKQEGLYLVGFLNDAVRPSYLAGQQVGNAFTEAFAPATELTESAYSVPKVNKENTASYMMSNNATPVAPRIINHFNIEKVDSKERVKEIAETVVKMATWNNETAGRSVQEE